MGVNDYVEFIGLSPDVYKCVPRACEVTQGWQPLQQRHTHFGVHPRPFLETREQDLSFGNKINGRFFFIVGDISF